MTSVDQLEKELKQIKFDIAIYHLCPAYQYRIPQLLTRKTEILDQLSSQLSDCTFEILKIRFLNQQPIIVTKTLFEELNQ